MKKLRLQPGEAARYPFALAAGLVLAASFPQIGVAGLAWLAPGLMLAAALGRGGGAAFRIGCVAGLAHHLASLHWLLFIPVTFAPIVGWLALAAFLALYQGAWVWLCWKIFPAKFSSASGPITTQLEEFVSTNWSQRLAWSLACAALWVAGEMVQARLFSGFPWNFLGASQYRMLPLIQIASFTGLEGVSFLMAWFSVSMVGAVIVVLRRPALRRTWAGEIALPLLAVVVIVCFGVRTVMPGEPTPRPTLKIALVQPSIPQKQIWNPNEAAARFQHLLQLSERALATRPDLLVWPESAVPNLFRHATNIHRAVTELARAHRVAIILCADDVAWRSGPRDDSDSYDFFNSSFLVTPEGKFGDEVGVYRKRRLVIFGEYVPLARWLPFLRDFTGVTGDFAAGTRAVPFRLPELRAKTSVLICFEDIFPHFVRGDVEDDTDFLLNLTNDAWFGDSAAQWQHAAGAVFRAVENGLPLVRCANNGLTCWIDERGRMNEVFFAGTKDIYGAGFKIAEVPLLAGRRRTPTFYTRHGDWFGWGCVILAGLAVARGVAQRCRAR